MFKILNSNERSSVVNAIFRKVPRAKPDTDGVAFSGKALDYIDSKDGTARLKGMIGAGVLTAVGAAAWQALTGQMMLGFFYHMFGSDAAVGNVDSKRAKGWRKSFYLPLRATSELVAERSGGRVKAATLNTVLSAWQTILFPKLDKGQRVAPEAEILAAAGLIRNDEKEIVQRPEGATDVQALYAWVRNVTKVAKDKPTEHEQAVAYLKAVTSEQAVATLAEALNIDVEAETVAAAVKALLAAVEAEPVAAEPVEAEPVEAEPVEAVAPVAA